MEDSVKRLRRRYEGFKRGGEDALKVRDEAYLVLKEARKMENHDVIDEVADMLLDLESSIEENKCKCRERSSIC